MRFRTLSLSVALVSFSCAAASPADLVARASLAETLEGQESNPAYVLYLAADTVCKAVSRVTLRRATDLEADDESNGNTATLVQAIAGALTTGGTAIAVSEFDDSEAVTGTVGVLATAIGVYVAGRIATDSSKEIATMREYQVQADADRADLRSKCSWLGDVAKDKDLDKPEPGQLVTRDQCAAFSRKISTDCCIASRGYSEVNGNDKDKVVVPECEQYLTMTKEQPTTVLQ